MADDDIFVSNDIELDVDFGEIFVIDQGIVTKVVASKYDPTKTYVVGDYVIHADNLFKCIVAIEEPEEFNSEKWTSILLANEVQTKANKSDTYTKQEVDTAIGALRKDIVGTLTAGQISITLQDSDITTNSTIEVFTDADVDYNSILVSTGSVTIAFDEQASDLGVKVRIT